MSFFKKEETGLFIAENGGPVSTSSPYFEKDSIAEDDTDRFNELETPSKRRRLSEEKDAAQDQEEDGSLFGDEEPTKAAEPANKPVAKRSGPFMEDSDSEDDEEEQPQAVIGFDQGPSNAPVIALAGPEALDAAQETTDRRGTRS